MEYVNLGKTDIKVAKVCLGCMGFGDPQAGMHSWTLSYEESKKIIKHALDQGINFFDTAMGYQGGTSEEYLGRAIKEFSKREDVVIATKFMPRSQEQINQGISAREHIETCINDSLKRLQMNYVDLYILHRWDNVTPIEETMEILNDLVKSKKVRAIGVSNFRRQHLLPLLQEEIIPMVNQLQLHPGMTQDDTIALCREYDILPEAYSPLGNGKLLNSDSLRMIAERYGKSQAQICVKWSIQHGFLPLPKSLHEERMKMNRSVDDFELKEEDMKALDVLEGFGTGNDPDQITF